MNSTPKFQWQNEILCKDIYPMRLQKLRDFLVFFKEADLWADYKDKNISTLSADVAEYERGMEAARLAEFKRYTDLKKYFLTADVKTLLSPKYPQLEEAALAEVQKNHQLFASSWPKDIRGERSFILMRIESLRTQIGFVKDRVKYLRRRLEGMTPEHPSRPKDEAELHLKENSALAMLLDEMDALRTFDETYNKVEAPKLEWYKRTKADPAFKTTEEEFLAAYKPNIPVTIKDIVRLKTEQYRKTLDPKTQYQLLADIRTRFEKEPKRFPVWLQYMVIHFSGMRYKSAHGSWADPKDLLVMLRLAEVEKEQLALSDAQVTTQCAEALTRYEGSAAKKGLAAATEKSWKDKAAMHLTGVKANGPKTKRAGLAALAAEEVRYEFMTLSTDQALTKLEAMKAQFPKWVWKTIVRLTPLRVKHVTAPGWETYTPEEEKERAADLKFGKTINDWMVKHTGGWRNEHGNTHEIIVTRAVCNETAEHAQHIRGHLPPGGLTDNAARYVKLAAEKTPGTYFLHATQAQHYTQGASIFWLRFVNNEPSQWQIPKPTQDINGVGLIPKEYLAARPQPKGGKNAAPTIAPWEYKSGGFIRTRTTLDAQKKPQTQTQWLRWIHEATVIEVIETADGTYVYTFETSLPDDDRGTSCLGIFRNSLKWNLEDGPEDEYNRSFVGYVPEGQPPQQNLKPLMDWNNILLK